MSLRMTNGYKGADLIICVMTKQKKWSCAQVFYQDGIQSVKNSKMESIPGKFNSIFEMDLASQISKQRTDVVAQYWSESGKVDCEAHVREDGFRKLHCRTARRG